MSAFSIRIWACLLCCLITSYSLASTLEIDATTITELSPYLSYAIDANDKVNIEQLLENPQALTFQTVVSQSIPAVNQSIWYRFSVLNSANKELEMVVNFDELLFDEVDFYYLYKGELENSQAGLNRPFNQRPIDYRFVAMPLKLAADSEVTVYFRLKSAHIPLVSPQLSSGLGFATATTTSTTVNLIFIGMGLGLCVFMGIFMPLAIAGKEAYGFMAFVITTTLVIISVSGFFQYLFPAQPELHKFLLVALLALNCCANLIMVNTFFELSCAHPRLHKIYIVTGLGFSAFIWAYALLGGYEALMLPLIGCTMVMFILLFSTAVMKYFQGFDNAGLFICAISFFFFTCLYTVLGAEGVLPYNAVIRHSVGSGVIVQAAILCLATAKKVSAEKKHAEELAKNIAIANAASRDKSEFLATMSHEIRTPMNGVLGMAQMLEHTSLNAEQKQYTQVIVNSGRMLLAVINDILDFSKVEAGKMQLEQTPFDLQKLLDHSQALFMPQAIAKYLDFNIHLDSSCPKNVCGDPIRLQQILNNLLSNAFKFTLNGQVQVNIQLQSRKDEKMTLLFSVKDSGIGISKDKQRQLFQAFTQADKSTTRSYGGTGLGLAISQQLVKLMGGGIGVVSDENSGAEFWFTAQLTLADPLSLSDAEGLPVQTELRNNAVTAPILIVEDNPVNQMVIKSMLAKMGVAVVLADDGGKALEVYQRDPLHFSAVLMDLEMPEKDGYATTIAIRDLENRANEGALIPIIALTAHVMEDNIQRCFDCGMDAVLTKPIQMPELLNTLKQFKVI